MALEGLGLVLERGCSTLPIELEFTVQGGIVESRLKHLSAGH